MNNDIKEIFKKQCDILGLNEETVLEEFMKSFIEREHISDDDLKKYIDCNSTKISSFKSSSHYEIYLRTMIKIPSCDYMPVWKIYKKCSCDYNDIMRWYKKAQNRMSQSNGKIIDIRIRRIVKFEKMVQYIMDDTEKIKLMLIQ